MIPGTMWQQSAPLVLVKLSPLETRLAISIFFHRLYGQPTPKRAPRSWN